MTFKGDLLPFQPPAVSKMVDRKKLLVAYDLGLGKTVMTIAAIEKLMDRGDISEPGIIVCLSSLKYQWASQIKAWSDSTPIVIDGTPAQRQVQYGRVKNWDTEGIDWVVMNYETVVRDLKTVQSLPCGFLVLDEATAIKNFKSQRTKAIKSLKKKTDVRFALTGTPIENGKPEELFSIMEFVDHTLLGPFYLFDKSYIVRNDWGGVDRYRNLGVLHDKMRPAIVRKTQNDPDVAPHLPDTIFSPPILVPLSAKGQGLYQHMVGDLLEELGSLQEVYSTSYDLLEDGDDTRLMDAAKGAVMSKIVCMRMFCDHPQLLRLSAQKASDPSVFGGSAYAKELLDLGLLETLPPATKLDKLVAYVNEFLECDDRNKVVIFSVFVPMLDFISQSLGEDKCLIYSGKLDAKTKNQNKERFNADPKIRVLVSSDAGGYGVDLPAANLLINYDLPWSSGAATQRNGRIRRASSSWPSVVIQDFLVEGSIEERQWLSLQHKNSVASAIVDGDGIDHKGGVPMTLGSLSKFLEGET